MGRGLQHPSGRVIALGRLLLATLFLIAIWLDVTQPAQFAVQTYALLSGYIVFAAIVTVVTWRNWWLDAQLAGPAHAVDIILFPIIVYLTEGYTSPFFTFFVFLLLTAAIRWGWRETALIAILVTLLYLAAGLLATPSQPHFELYRFIIRTGHLVILSLILIWFGVNQWRARYFSRPDELLEQSSLDRSAIETSLRAAIAGARARSGAFVWTEQGEGEACVHVADGDRVDAISIDQRAIGTVSPTPFLYDLAKKRGLTRDPRRNLRPLDPAEFIPATLARQLGIREGLAIPVRTATGEGQLFLEGLPNLSTDHIDVAEQIAADVAAHIQRHALLKAAEESAEARSRLSLARDLHDSVVQFLAGAAFRLEAMKRSEASGRDLGPELNELKQLMLYEQGELRSFITAMRRDSTVALRDMAKDLQALAERLSRQWGIRCELAAEPADLVVPIRVHLDTHQLVREAVANAVRHAGAKSVRIALKAEAEELKLDFVNDGAAYPDSPGGIEMPQSIKERVEHAGGAVELSRGMQMTKVSISLPLAGTRP